MKAAAERPQAFVAGIEADLGDAVISGQEQFLGVVDPQPRDKLMRGLAESVREQAMEIERRQFSLCGGVSQGSPPIESGGQIVAGAAQARIMRHFRESPTCVELASQTAGARLRRLFR